MMTPSYTQRVVEEAAKVTERFNLPFDCTESNVAKAVRAMLLPEPTQAEREGLARRLCEADGNNPDDMWRYPTSRVVRSEGDKAVFVAGYREMPMWHRFRVQADAVLKWLREGGK